MFKFLKKKIQEVKAEIFSLENYLMDQKPIADIKKLISERPECLENLRESPFHLLCRYAENADYFAQVWTTFIDLGFKHTTLNANHYNALHVLIINNPYFFSPIANQESKFASKAFDFLVPQYFNFSQLPSPYDEVNPFYFFKDYNHVFSDYLERYQNPICAYYSYKPRAQWEKIVLSIDIAVKEKHLLSLSDIGDITFALTGSRCKSFKKFFTMLLEESNPSQVFFSKVNALREIAKLPLNEEQKMKIFTYCFETNNYSPFDSRYYDIHDEESLPYFIAQMPFSRFFKLFIETNYSSHHTFDLVQQMVGMNLPLDYRDFNNGQDLHDYCSREVNKVIRERKAQELLRLQEGIDKYRLEIAKLHNLKFKDYELIIPKSGEDLIIWGGKLSICVGNMRYCERLAEGKLFIVLIKQNGKEYGCCHCSVMGNIEEIKASYNRPINSDIHNFLRKILPETLQIK